MLMFACLKKLRFIYQNRLALCTAIINLIVFPHNANAVLGGDYIDLPPEQLFNATVISVSKTSERLMDAPAAIYVLTNKDIIRSGATSIPEVLRLVPGLQVARLNTGSWAVSARGFNSSLANKLLVLIDGREVYNHLYSGVYWDVQDTLLEDIDRIEVIRGPGATLWGSNAVNGVINIITKNSSDTQGTLVSGLAGNQEKIAAARYGGKTGNKGNYRAYGKYLYRDEQQALPGKRAIDEWDAYRGGFRADWKNGKEPGSFMLQGDAYQSNVDQFRTIPQFTAPFNSVNEETVNASGAHLLGQLESELANGSKLTVQSYVDYTLRDLHVLEDENTAFDLDAQIALPEWQRHNILTGGRVRYSINDLKGSPQVTFASANSKDTLFSGFIQDKITLVPKEWFLTLGTKLEHNDYSGFEVQPNARLQWHPNDRQMVWGSVARAVRTPSRLERDVNLLAAVIPPTPTMLMPTAISLVPNPHFDSEELMAYELGYRNQWTPSLLFDVATFYNDYDKLATTAFFPTSVVDNGIDPVHFSIPLAITNMTQGKTYGVETVINWQANDALNFSAAYSYLNITLDGPPSTVAASSEAAEGISPRHQFSIRSLWDVTDDHTLDATLYYVGSLSTSNIKDYWRFDVRWGWQITDGVEWALVGQNLLDDAHQEFAGSTNITEIERSIYGRVTWHF